MTAELDAELPAAGTEGDLLVATTNLSRATDAQDIGRDARTTGSRGLGCEG